MHLSRLPSGSWRRDMSPEHDRLTPREQEAINDILIDREKEDPANWRDSGRGYRYYVGPQMQGDGTIDWSGHDGWPDSPDDKPPTNAHGNVIDYGPQFDGGEWGD